MTDSRFPLTPDPDDAGDLPAIFDQLTWIDVVDGELVPRPSPWRSGDLPGAS